MGLAKILYARWIRNFDDSDQFERSKVRLLISFTAIGTIVSLAYFFVQPNYSLNVPRFVFLLLPILLNGFCFLLFFKVPQNLTAHGLIASYWFCFSLGIFYSGGIESLVLPWMGLMPVMAGLLINFRNSVYWFVISVISMISFGVFAETLPPYDVESSGMKSLLSAVGLSLILFLFTNLFDRVRYRILQVLKVRNEDLKDQKSEIDRINLQLKEKVEEIADKNNQLEKYWNVLIDVAKHRCVDQGILEIALGHVANVTANTLDASRVSVWTYHDDTDNERIECVIAFNSEKNEFFQQSALFRKDNPQYFQAIKREDVIVARNALEHHDTREFANSYLLPLNIKSMLDAPFFSDGRLAGVLCVEHQHEVRPWTHEDIVFVTSIAEIISLSYRAVTRRMQREELKRLSEKIIQQNETLEERVKHRTRELMERNEQLAEYAFINAHLVRGPLCRVLGLINLLEYPNQDHDEVRARLLKSGVELEEVVSKMTRALSEDLDFNRKKI
ncbi:MAG: GAF domain-containing protein [Cyclobacteriaceae bacterium]